jgi:hypothetical protein
MRSVIILAIINMAMIYAFWGNWPVMIMMCFASFYAYKKFLIDYSDRMLK